LIGGVTPGRTELPCGALYATRRNASGSGAKIATVTSGGLTTATAFWSYAHSDDDGSGGQIRRLKEQVDHAFKRHSGELLRSFFDRHGPHRLEWGEEWRSKISTTISGTTFFIAVISPSYLKSASCQDEFMQFWEIGKDSELKNLLLPILWVKVYPETEIEKQIWEIAKERQYIDWTSTRRSDEGSSEYKNLIDEMGERLADAARKVADVPEKIETDVAGKPNAEGGDPAPRGDGGPSPTSGEPEEPPGLFDILAEVTSQGELFGEHLTKAMTAVNEMPEKVSLAPLSAGATAAQRLIYSKRLASQMTPSAVEFEQSAKQAEEQARLLNTAMFNFLDILKDPVLSEQTDLENIDVDAIRRFPAELAEKFGNYNESRAQIAAFGRMSRDLRAPMSAIERGFDSLDAIMELIRDWTEAFGTLGDEADSGEP
jgi:hypothetical protein